MNHPNLPVLNWVYHTRKSFFRNKVSFDAARGFYYNQKKAHDYYTKLTNPLTEEEREELRQKEEREKEEREKEECEKEELEGEQI